MPVLVVAGVDRHATEAALAALCDDLADAVVGVAQPADLAGTVVAQPADLAGAGERVDDYTVAVCNQGMPSFNVDAGGDLYLSLLRSCSGWPSGVWLDPPRRTAPDGSNFQFQHWTHEFRCAIVAGAGDWRRLGAVRAGREHNHPRVARQVPAHPGELPATAAFVTIDSDDVVLTALKPLGNPMARMAGTAMEPSDGIALRLYECHGRQVDTWVTLLAPLREAFVTDVLEEQRRPIDVAGGAARHELGPCAVETLGAVVASGSRSDAHDGPGDAGRVELGRRREPAQPVFSDYWLHNKGAAPIGYQPVTVHIPLRAIASDAAFDVPVVVASERTDAPSAGIVEIVAPHGWHASPPAHPYRLAPGAHMAVSSTVTPPAGAAPGRYFVAARIRDEAGQLHEDVVTVDHRTTAFEPAPDAAVRALVFDRATRKAAVVDQQPDPATMTALGGELRAEIAGDAVAVGPGGCGWLEVALRNLVCDEIRGEAQMISPWGTWEHSTPWTQGFVVPPAQATTVRFALCYPNGLPRTAAWALVKVAYFGRVLYTPSVALVFGGEQPQATATQTGGAVS